MYAVEQQCYQLTSAGAELNHLLSGEEVASAKIIRSGKILIETTTKQNAALLAIDKFAAVPATEEVAVNMSSIQGLIYAPDLFIYLLFMYCTS